MLVRLFCGWLVSPYLLIVSSPGAVVVPGATAFGALFVFFVLVDTVWQLIPPKQAENYI